MLRFFYAFRILQGIRTFSSSSTSYYPKLKTRQPLFRSILLNMPFMFPSLCVQTRELRRDGRRFLVACSSGYGICYFWIFFSAKLINHVGEGDENASKHEIVCFPTQSINSQLSFFPHSSPPSFAFSPS